MELSLSKGGCPRPRKKRKWWQTVSTSTELILPPTKRRRYTPPSGYTDRVRAPFWNADLEDIYNLCPYPRITTSSSSSENSQNGCSASCGSNTWFSSNRTVMENSISRPWRSYIKLPAESIVSIDTLKPPKQLGGSLKYRKGGSEKDWRDQIRTRRIKLRLNKSQKKVRLEFNLDLVGVWEEMGVKGMTV